MHSQPVIEIENLTVDYKPPGGKPIHAVCGLDLRVNEGEVVGFIGPNGAGKSTAIKVLMGFRKPTSGRVTIFGRDPGLVDVRRRIGFLPEVALYYPFLTARETLRMFAKLSEIPKANRESTIDQLLEKVGLVGRDKEPVRGFSKGMLQRVGIAQAIMGEPDLLILDEVTSGLDPVARYDVRRILMDFRAKGKTVFFSSHELSEVTMLSDRVVLIDDGKVLCEGTMSELLKGFNRHVVTVEVSALPATLPPGILTRFRSNGRQVLVADSVASKAELRAMVERAGGSILDETTEPGSLEDYFVSAIGHKVT